MSLVIDFYLLIVRLSDSSRPVEKMGKIAGVPKVMDPIFVKSRNLNQGPKPLPRKVRRRLVSRSWILSRARVGSLSTLYEQSPRNFPFRDTEPSTAYDSINQ